MTMTSAKMYFCKGTRLRGNKSPRIECIGRMKHGAAFLSFHFALLIQKTHIVAIYAARDHDQVLGFLFIDFARFVQQTYHVAIYAARDHDQVLY